jgi:phosphomevalonate kinase
MRLIALSAKRRGGKTTLGDILFDKYGYNPISLADPLKAMCREQFGLTKEQTDGGLKEVIDERYNKTPRQIMIGFGQFYRSIDPDFWTKKLFESMRQHTQAQLRTFVVTDVRFTNEMEWMRRHSALSVRLERSPDLTGAYINDVSETDLDDYVGWDIYIPSDKNVNMQDLERVAERIHDAITAGLNR